MHLSPSDPDVATLIRKIKQKRLDLQPNFQRGEVWGKPKKQRLIDSILRGWHIPPIHVIQVPNSNKQEVLDGQQRLAAIRDFIDSRFPINGTQDPEESFIKQLDGMYWNDLSGEVQGIIEDFTIRILTISDYKPGEPGELFFRLNQPTNLTSAEQRNAYFGEARQQVKELSDFMIDVGYNSDTIGYSNSRMAYDDVIAKFILTIENNSLRKKITASSVTKRYRDSDGFSNKDIAETKEVLSLLIECIKRHKQSLKLNKATTISWLTFIYSFKRSRIDNERLFQFFTLFEENRKWSTNTVISPTPKGITKDLVSKLFEIYQDRGSSRVADISSVVLRDLAMWSIFVIFYHQDNYPEKLSVLRDSVFYIGTKEPSTVTEKSFEEVASNLDWGVQL